MEVGLYLYAHHCRPNSKQISMGTRQILTGVNILAHKSNFILRSQIDIESNTKKLNVYEIL